MNRAGQHVQNMLLLRCYHAWRLDARMEHTMKVHHTKIDAKRQQLVGVQQMFRNFAAQLEGGLKESSGKDSSRIFDNVSHHRVARKNKKDENPGSRSLPEIKGSGRTKKPAQPAQTDS